MKVISLLQPWASLTVLGHKIIETRSWNTKYRGELLIHASASPKMLNLMAHTYFNEYLPVRFIDDQRTGKTFCEPLKETMTLGAIIGKVYLADTFPMDAVRLMIEQNMSCYIGGKRIDFSEKEVAFGDYSPGRYGWILQDPVLFKHPIPAKGKLGLWDYEFEGNDDSHILQCNNCGFAACNDFFPLDKMNIDTDEEDWDVWCPKCESRELNLIIDQLP